MRIHIVRKMLRPFLASLITLAILLPLAVPVYAEETAGQTPSGMALSTLETVTDLYVSARSGTTAALAVAAVMDGEIVFDKAYGYADMERQTAADQSTVFEWGSATKLLVWTSVMQLVEEGKLDLEADIREYLPEGFLTKLKYDQPIQLLNLMNHNAGWEDQITDMFVFDKDQIPELGEALQQFEPRQVYPPGEVVAYSNFVLASSIGSSENISLKHTGA